MIIKTSRGLDILADDEDEELLSRFSWYAVSNAGRFYAHAHVSREIAKGDRRILMHRLLLQPPTGMVVHHINNNGLDNRRANLCIVTQRDNTRSHTLRRPTGVHPYSPGVWRAQTRDAAGKRVSLGLFRSEAEAHKAVSAYRRKSLDWVRVPPTAAPLE